MHDAPRRVLLIIGFVLSSSLGGQQPAPPAQPPVFRSGVNLVLVDVVVRDRNGAVVRGLTADDFELLEDGVRQQILTFAFEEITSNAAPIENASTLGAAAAASAARTAAPAPAASPAAAVPASAAADDTPSHPLTSDEVAGHRLLTLVFDTSSMQPDDVQKAVDGAMKWVDEQMTPADLVAVASIELEPSGADRLHEQQGARAPGAVRVLRDRRDGVCGRRCQHRGNRRGQPGRDRRRHDRRRRARRSSTRSTTTCGCARSRRWPKRSQPIQQKKAIIYFSSGMQRSGTDNQVELRAAVNAAVRANVAIYPVDARGLQAVVPGGSARQGSRGGLAAFSGERGCRAVHAARRTAGNADLARVRHRRHGVYRHQRLRRGLHQGRAGHLVVLHPRFLEHATRTRMDDSAASRSA